MQRIQSRISRLDPGYLLVLAICLISIWPFLSRPGLPQETDAELHVFRLYELSTLVRGGELYPRWAPDFYHGYGYPIFNYYAPLTYYLGLGVELLPHFDAVAGVKSVFLAGILAGAVGLYGFVCDNWGRRAGYVAASLLVYSPYIQYIDPYARGVLPESFSFGMFPLALWALDRLWRGGQSRAFLAATFTTAMVILSHNLMALLFYGLLWTWSLGRIFVFNQDTQGGRRPIGRAATQQFTALLLGLGLAAFFWMPVYLEREAVNLDTLIGIGDNYDFRTHFLSMSELLSGTRRLDWSATEPAFNFNLGIVQWLSAAAALMMLLRRRIRQGAHVFFFAVFLAILLYLMLPVSTLVWQSVPFLPYYQFPWRLLGPAALMVAIVGGAGASALLDELRERAQNSRWISGTTATVATMSLVLLPILAGLPLSQPAPWPDFGEVNMLRMTLIEHQGRWLGTTSTADYVPVTVDVIPKRNGEMVKGFYEGVPLDRVNRAKGMIPDGATVKSEAVMPLKTRYHIASDEAFRLRLFVFDFPGWIVRIDGTAVETELGRPEGFIVVPVPAGIHEVEVEFDGTPARRLAWTVSLVSLLLILLTAWRFTCGVGSVTYNFKGTAFPDWPLMAAVIGISLVHILLLDPQGWLHFQSEPYHVVTAQEQLFADFGEQIALIGYDAPGSTFAPGDAVEVTLYWQALNALDINFQVFVHLLGSDGRPVTQSDKLNPGEFPTRRWPIDKYVRDEHRLLLPADLAAGEYTVSTGLWVSAEGWRLGLLDEDRRQIGDSYPLFTIVVRDS